MFTKTAVLTFLGLVPLVASTPLAPIDLGIAQRTPQLQTAPRGNLEARDETVHFPLLDADITVPTASNQAAESGTYLRFLRLADGPILAISSHPVDNGNEKVLQVTRSTNDAQDFEFLAEVARGPGDISNGFLIQLPSGVILAAFRNHDLDANGTQTYYRITICKSTNGGQRWEFVTQAVEKPADAEQNGFWEPFMRIGKGGEIQLFYSGELAQNNQETFLMVSRDEGQTWSEPENLELHEPSERFRDGMVGIIETTDMETGADALVMVFEVGKTRENGNFLFNLAYIVSYNDGADWDRETRDVIRQLPENNCGAPQIATIGPNFAVVFMTDEGRTPAAPDYSVNTDVKIMFGAGLSGGNISWTAEPMLISEAPSVWPGTFQTENPQQIRALFGTQAVPYSKLVTRTPA